MLDLRKANTEDALNILSLAYELNFLFLNISIFSPFFLSGPHLQVLNVSSFQICQPINSQLFNQEIPLKHYYKVSLYNIIVVK